MKKIMVWLIVVISLVFLSFVYWYYNDGKLGKGNYFIYNTGFHAIKSFKDKKLYLMDVYKSKYNNNFIIAIRIPGRVFYGKKNCETFFYPIMHYLILEKQTGKVMETDDYRKFQQKLKKFHIDLMFNKNEIEQVKQEFQQNKHIYKNTQSLKYFEEYCKEDFIYPIEVF